MQARNINPLTWTRRTKFIGLLILIAVVTIGLRLKGSITITPQYQTAVAERGSLVSSISASGNVTTGNNLAIVTNATGTVNKVYVKNGDNVTKAQKIADITLDQDASQKQAAAYASYLSAKNNLASAQNQLWTLQNQEFAANQKFINGAVAENLDTSDPTYIQQQSAWLAAEGSYKNQANVIQQAQAAVNNSWLTYQQISSTITAPSTGVVANLTIAPGSVIKVQSGTSTGASTPQQLGTITQPNQNPQASVDLAEIDVPKVNPGQNVTMTLDAFSNKTFTGKVLTVDTNGQVSSGVTTYPATIVFDTPQTNVYPNMAVTANIITKVDNDVILVPSGAVQTTNGQATVRVLRDGQAAIVPVTVGDSNDTQTVITAGITEGETVITGIVTPGATSSTRNTSPFGGFGGGGGGGVRIFRGNGG